MDHSGAKLSPLQTARLRTLRPTFDAFLEQSDAWARIARDPIEFPHRYQSPADIEAAAFLSASLAYGRVDLFKPKLEALLLQMGPSPSQFLATLTPAGAARLVDGFVYRFNVATDLAVLLMGIGAVQREQGSLEVPCVESLLATGDLKTALVALTRAVRGAAPLTKLRKLLGPERGLDHLLPLKLGPGASKRLNLFLRWMVRGPDGVDFGLWRRIPSSALIIPLDTHSGRMGKHLGLTRRNDLSWKTAEDITAGLRVLDPEDPVRFDFALCHFGMTGTCPLEPSADTCRRCVLLGACRTGPRMVRRRARSVPSLQPRR